MALESRVFKHFNLERNEEGDIKFAPSKLNGEELYSVINSKDEFCGYVTPGFLESIIVNDNGVERLRKGFQVNSFGQRDGKFIIRNIVLEKPNKECSDFEYSVVLRPIDTSKIDPTLETLTIIANKKFSIDNGNTTLDLKFNDHIVEADTFNIKLYGNAKTTLDIELARNCARDIIVDGMRPRSGVYYSDQDVYFKLKSTNKNGPINIEVYNFVLASEKDNQKNLVYPYFETGKNFLINDGSIELPYMNDLSLKTPFKVISTNGDIILKSNVAIRFDYRGSRGSGVTARESIKLDGVEMIIDGESTINGSFKVDRKERQYYKSFMSLKKINSNSDIVFTPLTKDKMKAVLEECKLDNGNKPILLKGEAFLNGVDLRNKKDKELLLRNVHIDYSNLINVSDLTEFSMSNAHLENFNFNNKSQNKDEAFYCDIVGLSFDDKTIYSSFKNVNISLDKDKTFFSTTGPLNFSNVVINGTTNIVTEDSNSKISPIPITMSNVALTNATITLSKNVDDMKKETVINTSELTERLILSDCDKIEGSFVKKSELRGFKEIKDSIIEEREIVAKDVDKIINCSLEDLDILEKKNTKSIATSELEIL
jgi:hypothetical protein